MNRQTIHLPTECLVVRSHFLGYNDEDQFWNWISPVTIFIDNVTTPFPGDFLLNFCPNVISPSISQQLKRRAALPSPSTSVTIGRSSPIVELSVPLAVNGFNARRRPRAQKRKWRGRKGKSWIPGIRGADTLVSLEERSRYRMFRHTLADLGPVWPTTSTNRPGNQLTMCALNHASCSQVA
ncbi:hypothetical protein J6590_008131 [Homalodisca vitripennis]|nr:hypothetical protein J6590_008131 [Homalodisca vitripennis]